MLNRVLEIQEENRYLSLNRGFIVIRDKETELAQIPLDDVGVLLISAQSTTITKNVLNALAENGCISVLCGKNYTPETMVLPVYSHCFSTKIIKHQISASEPLKKRIWQKIIIKKIQNQALCLKFCGKLKESGIINKISSSVKSGDSENREGYSAKMYFQFLFGPNFVRNRSEEGINSFLNYGYAIIRASMVRAICAHGLIPGLGIHHSNNLDNFCLADDLFEIYRPIVDRIVYELMETGYRELTPESKKELAKALKIEMHTIAGRSSACQSMQYVAASYVKALETGKPDIILPDWEENADGITVIE